MGKTLIIIGISILIIGIIIEVSSRGSLIGRLPGDIVVQKKNFNLYFPITTSLLLSLALTLMFILIRWIRNIL